MTSESLLLSRQDYQDVLSSLGFKNRSNSQNLWKGSGHCHGGRNPSAFFFYYGKGRGVCATKRCFDKSADIYSIVQHQLSCDFPESKKYVTEITGKEFDERNLLKRTDDYFNKISRKIDLIEKKEKVKKKIINVWKEYHENHHPYWFERGFSQETLDYFEAGYNPFEDRITMPIFDHLGNFVSLKQRLVDDSKINEDNPKYLHDSYLAGDVLFGFSKVLENKKLIMEGHSLFKGLIVVEGNLDTMWAKQLGFLNFSSTQTNQITRGQAELIEANFQDLLVVRDEDQGLLKWPGNNLLVTAKREMGSTMNIYTSRLPRGYKDVDNIKGEYAALILKEVIESRVKA